MLKIGKNWGKIANYPPQCSTKIGTPGSAPNEQIAAISSYCLILFPFQIYT